VGRKEKPGHGNDAQKVNGGQEPIAAQELGGEQEVNGRQDVEVGQEVNGSFLLKWYGGLP